MEYEVFIGVEKVHSKRLMKLSIELILLTSDQYVFQKMKVKPMLDT